MNFNFDEIIERRNTDSGKWNSYGPDVLPMWVADMDFKSPQPIIDALEARVRQGTFGYGDDAKSLREVLVDRMQQHYAWTIQPEDIVFLPGLVSGLNAVTRALGERGAGALVTTPVYGPFLTAPGNQYHELQVAPLLESIYGRRIRYTVDMDRLDTAVQPNTRLFILCNPHNPVGRSYTRAELTEMAAFCEKHNLVICSDEIHCDLLLDQVTHIPTASLAPEIAERTITLMAPSKTFNVPGLGASFAIITDPELRAQVHARGGRNRAPRQHTRYGRHGSSLYPMRRVVARAARLPASKP